MKTTTNIQITKCFFCLRRRITLQLSPSAAMVQKLFCSGIREFLFPIAQPFQRVENQFIHAEAPAL